MAPIRHFHLTLQDKMDVLKKLDNGARIGDLSKIYKIPRTTMYNIRANRHKIESFLNNKSLRMDYRRTTKITKHHDMERDLFNWYMGQIKDKIPVKTEELREIALYLYEKHGHTEPFVASDGWLYRFKKRFGITPFKHEKDMMKIIKEKNEIGSIKNELEDNNWGNNIEFVECVEEEEEDVNEKEYKEEIDDIKEENDFLDYYEITVDEGEIGDLEDEEEEREEDKDDDEDEEKYKSNKSDAIFEKVDIRPRITKDMFIGSATKKENLDNTVTDTKKPELQPRIKKEMFVGSPPFTMVSAHQTIDDPFIAQSKSPILISSTSTTTSTSTTKKTEENMTFIRISELLKPIVPPKTGSPKKTTTNNEEALRGIDVSIEWAEQNESNPTIMAALYKLRGDIIYKMYREKK